MDHALSGSRVMGLFDATRSPFLELTHAHTCTSRHITCSCNNNFMACYECTFTKQTVVYLGSICSRMDSIRSRMDSIRSRLVVMVTGVNMLTKIH